MEYTKFGRSFFLKALALVQERTRKLSEVAGFLQFFFTDDTKLSIHPDLYTHAKMGTNAQTAKEALDFSSAVIQNIDETHWNIESLKSIFMEEISKKGYKNGFVLYPLRVALSGEEFSPGTFELLEIFGKERSIARIESAQKQLLSL